MDYSALISKMVMFVLLLAIGYVMARKKILGPEFCKSCSALLLNVFIVASILSSVMGDRPQLSGADFGNAMMMLCLTMVLTYVIAFLCGLPFLKEERGVKTEMVMAITNTLFVGLPVVQAVCGSEAVFYVGMSCVPYNLLLYSYGVWRLKSGSGEKGIRIRDMITVCLVAAITALLIFLIDPPIPAGVTGIINTISGATVPLSMIVIGASMGGINPARAFGEKRSYVIALERLIIAPLITYFVVKQFTGNETLLISCMVLAGCPVGVISTPLFIRYGHDGEYSSKAVMVTTVLSLLTLPLLIAILF